MPNEDVAKTLTEFLTQETAPIAVEGSVDVKPTEIVSKETVITPAGTTEVIAIRENPVYRVITDVCRLRMCAKNLHYRYIGRDFYGIHLLADRIWELEKFADDLIETYIMGSLQQLPPKMEEVNNDALTIVLDMPAPLITSGLDADLIEQLKAICKKTIADVEIAKQELNIMAGTQSVLDNISQKALVAIGLVSHVD